MKLTDFQKGKETTSDKFKKILKDLIALLIGLSLIAIAIGIPVSIVWILIHFITKWW